MSRGRRVRAWEIGLALLLAAGATARAADDFVFAGARVKSGTTLAGSLAVPAGRDGAATEIPYIVVHGTKKGPVLALVAGVHAYEYPPILSLYRLKGLVDAKSLRGPYSWSPSPTCRASRRTIHHGPDDWKNLNRVFPGDPAGTTSQRIAAALDAEVVQRADVLVDMHCGDGNEAVIPYTYWMVSGRESPSTPRPGSWPWPSACLHHHRRDPRPRPQGFEIPRQHGHPAGQTGRHHRGGLPRPDGRGVRRPQRPRRPERHEAPRDDRGRTRPGARPRLDRQVPGSSIPGGTASSPRGRRWAITSGKARS